MACFPRIANSSKTQQCRRLMQWIALNLPNNILQVCVTKNFIFALCNYMKQYLGFTANYFPDMILKFATNLVNVLYFQKYYQNLVRACFYWFKYIALLAVSIGCYLAAFAFSGILFIWFNPSGHDCGLNVFFIVMTMVLAFSFGIIALHPAVNGSLLPASVISVYCAYVCYTGLSSEPRDYVCNGLHNKASAVSLSTLILGMLTTVLSVIYSALRAGSSTTFLSPPSSPKAGTKKPLLEGDDVEEGKETKEKEARPVSYSYSFFHLIFALASMYSAMLLSGWTSSSDSSDLVDVGWTSVWVRICTEWVTAALYVWTLVAPLIIPDREFF
ncbi:putative serine incorporator [Gossypium australe]|uniref:Putative serine incorporator n=1 Tax=Gossypium australe TaxID=47621 RepID=A0A5B6WX48_9ROSI|nr:putative serine incorporator [Gossypium australe]